MERGRADELQLPSLAKLATSQAPQVLHGHLRQAHATNAQLRKYNQLLHEKCMHETDLLKQQLAEQRVAVEDSIAAQRAVEAMAKDTQTAASAEIWINLNKCNEAEKAVSSTERMCLQQIAKLEEQVHRAVAEQNNLRLQRDALARAFTTIANEILGGATASSEAIAQEAQVVLERGCEAIVRDAQAWQRFNFALDKAGAPHRN
eukprot:jgi/Ulvmu1/11627/UM008_0031.1